MNNGFTRMILYQLRCIDEHSFEAWFRDSASFDMQAQSGDVECPYCGSTRISKAVMAPNIVSSTKDTSELAQEPAPVDSSQVSQLDEQRAEDVAQRILDAVGHIREYAEENFEDVGEDFAKEARKIHHGEPDERGIYGKASEQDAEDLAEDGIDFVRLPGSSRRSN